MSSCGRTREICADFAITLAIAVLVAMPLRVAADDLPEGVESSQNPADISLSPAESLARIAVPDGFHVTLFAGEPDVRRPIAFDLDDRGRLWVLENYSHPHWSADRKVDRVVILEDLDHDGRFDTRKIFWDEGRYASAIAIGHGGVWIGDTPEILFIPDRDRDDRPDGPPEVILDGFIHFSTENVLNNFHWGPDGWLHGALGQTNESLVGAPGAPAESRVSIRRGLWRVHPVTHEFEVVARGMVNPWGADFDAHGDLFTVNTVTAHLWYIVPGMECEDHTRGGQVPYASLQGIGDHLHWGGGNWTDSRRESLAHSVAGGGHAHCGAMIYLGDNWPERYRGTLFTCNLHGNRINNDELRPRGSNHVGVHREDFLLANDPWFRGLSIRYGPDGGVFVSDWHDFGECHDADGGHRTSGRIYKIVHGKVRPFDLDLSSLPARRLAELHSHANEWIVRHARRILHERTTRGEATDDARVPLLRLLREADDTVLRLRAMWTLSQMSALDHGALLGLLDDDDEHLRRWAVRLLVDTGRPDDATLRKLERLAFDDPSPAVRLQLASGLRRLPHESRLAIARGLAAHAEDARDAYLPLMTWYGVEPVVLESLDAAIELAMESAIPLLREFIVRRAIEGGAGNLERVLSLATEVSGHPARVAVLPDVLRGMLAAIGETRGREPPAAWAACRVRLETSSDPEVRSLVIRLAIVFGDSAVIARLRERALDRTVDEGERRAAFDAIVKIDGGLTTDDLHRLVRTPSSLRGPAIRALALASTAETASVLLESFADLDEIERQDAVGVLGTRSGFAARLLDAMDSGLVGAEFASAHTVQRLRSVPDEAIRRRVEKRWPRESSTRKKADAIQRYLERMSPEFLETGDAAVGRALFDRACASCHKLFGEGGAVGPDLTGTGRRNVAHVIANLVDPSATIDAAYRLTTALTADGRLYSGYLVKQDASSVSLRTPETTVRLEMRDVARLTTSNESLMPEGLLRDFRDEDLRDLLRYLASETQVAPAAR